MLLFLLLSQIDDGKLLTIESTTSYSIKQISIFNSMFGKNGIYINSSPAEWVVGLPNVGLKIQKNNAFVHITGYIVPQHFSISGLPDTMDFGRWAMLLNIGYTYKWATGNIHYIKGKSSMIDMGLGLYFHHIILETGWGIPSGFYISSGIKFSINPFFFTAGVIIPGIEDISPVLPKGDIGFRF